MKPGVMLVLAVAFLSLAMPGIAPAAEARHSGRVMAVDPGAGTVQIQEVVAWTGPETGTVERTIRLTPDTTVQLVRREADVDLPRWPNAWEEQRISVDALRPGDFVTVITGDGDVAVSLDVVRPES